MSDDGPLNTGASVPDQALAVPVEPVARLDPSGFDPSRSIHGEDGQHFSIHGGPKVGICNGWNGDGFNRQFVVGWNSKEFNYCPRGAWSEWVELARRILAFDAYASEVCSSEKPHDR